MHDLIKNGLVISTHDFGADSPPVLADHKGKWLPRIEVSDPLYVDPETQNLTVNHVLTETESRYEEVATDKTQPELDAIAEQKEDQDDVQSIRVDAQVKALILARPAGIENYINNNVKTLATAKTVLIILAKAISAIGKREFR